MPALSRRLHGASQNAPWGSLGGGRREIGVYGDSGTFFAVGAS